MNLISDRLLSWRKRVRTVLIFATSLFTVATLTVPSVAFCQSQSSSQTTTAPDNSGQSTTQESTAGQQSNRKSDLAITRDIRKSMVADKSLSTYAHNIKIITRHGMVTLKGPVKSEDEKQAVASKAEAVVGSADMVKSDLTVANR